MIGAEEITKERERAQKEVLQLSQTPKDFQLYLLAHQSLALWVIAEQFANALARGRQ